MTITVSPSELTLDALDATAQLEAMARDRNGAAMSVPFSWRSSDTAVVSVDADGLVTASGNGTATVTVSSVTAAKRVVKGQSDRCRITLEPGGHGDVSITSNGQIQCNAVRAICTAGGEQLSNIVKATVVGPPALTVADARVEDGSATGTILVATGTNTTATGAPTIAGTARVDETLTASIVDIVDANGIQNAAFEYQWTRSGTDIECATGSSYTLVDADKGTTIAVRVTWLNPRIVSDIGGVVTTSDTRKSARSGTPIPSVPGRRSESATLATGVTTISATVQEG